MKDLSMEETLPTKSGMPQDLFLMNLEGVDDKQIDFELLTIADKWILHKLQ